MLPWSHASWTVKVENSPSQNVSSSMLGSSFTIRCGGLLVATVSAVAVACRHHAHRCCRCWCVHSLPSCPPMLCHSQSRHSDCTKMKTPVWSQAKWMSSDGENQIVKEKPNYQILADKRSCSKFSLGRSGVMRWEVGIEKWEKSPVCRMCGESCN